MTRPELREIARIVTRLECLHEETDDMVAQTQLGEVIRSLAALHATAREACKATEKTN